MAPKETWFSFIITNFDTSQNNKILKKRRGNNYILFKRLILGALHVHRLPLLAQQHQHMNDKEMEKAGGIPQGWNAWFDEASADSSDVKFTVTNDVLHFNANASDAAIYYKPWMKASGSFSVKGTFSQLEKTHHPEAYGRFIGGNNLQKNNQQYLYFLIHQGGKFLIKRRHRRIRPKRLPTGPPATPCMRWEMPHQLPTN